MPNIENSAPGKSTENFKKKFTTITLHELIPSSEETFWKHYYYWGHVIFSLFGWTVARNYMPSYFVWVNSMIPSITLKWTFNKIKQSSDDDHNSQIGQSDRFTFAYCAGDLCNSLFFFFRLSTCISLCVYLSSCVFLSLVVDIERTVNFEVANDQTVFQGPQPRSRKNVLKDC